MNYHDLNRGNTHDVNSEVLEVSFPLTEINYCSFLKIYRVNTGNPSEFEAATPRTLLWHGTPIFNIPSIVLNGLKIPETKSLSMFGAGIYFSDCFTKSAFYSRVSMVLVFLTLELAFRKTKASSTTHMFYSVK